MMSRVFCLAAVALLLSMHEAVGALRCPRRLRKTRKELRKIEGELKEAEAAAFAEIQLIKNDGFTWSGSCPAQIFSDKAGNLCREKIQSRRSSDDNSTSRAGTPRTIEQITVQPSQYTAAGGGCYGDNIVTTQLTEARGLYARWGQIMCQTKVGTPSVADGVCAWASMTLELCQQQCVQANFGWVWFAVQNGDQCFCAAPANNAADKGPGYAISQYGASDNCNTPCDGDVSQICGGSFVNSIYEINYNGNPQFPSGFVNWKQFTGQLTNNPPPITNYGCFKDNLPDSSLSVAQNFASRWGDVQCKNPGSPITSVEDCNFDSMTLELCQSKCTNASPEYVYFAVQFGVQCFCGKDTSNGGKRLDFYGVPPINFCNNNCMGNNDQTCGGPYINSVYTINRS